MEEMSMGVNINYYSQTALVLYQGQLDTRFGYGDGDSYGDGGYGFGQYLYSQNSRTLIIIAGEIQCY